MTQTYVRQESQIGASDTYDDTIAAGTTMESATVSIEDDLNSLRSQIKRYSGETNWYDTPSGRTIDGLDTDLTDLEGKRILGRSQIITDITVGASDNFVILSVAGSETPTATASVGASAAIGAVVAFHAGTFGTASLDEVAGANALQPKNLCIVREATTGDNILSSGRRVYALIQSEIVTDGHTFNDTTQQVQLSFVRQNATADDLEACPAADIQGLDINYSYVIRVSLDALPEDVFLGDAAWIDQTAAVDVTLDNAIDNQSGAATQVQNIEVRITDTFDWAFQDSTGGADILSIKAAVGADEVEFNVDLFDVNNSATADFLNGVAVDSGGTLINLGVTAGQIDSAGALTIISAAAGDLTVQAAGEMYLDDVNQAGSTWAQTAGIKLSETTAEWDAFEVLFGEVSILSAITQAASISSLRTRYEAVLTADVAADVNVTGSTGPNLDAQLGDYSALTFVSDVNIYLNGVLMRNGVDAAANFDVYPGTTPADGDLKFEFPLVGTGSRPDRITMELFA